MLAEFIEPELRAAGVSISEMCVVIQDQCPNALALSAFWSAIHSAFIHT